MQTEQYIISGMMCAACSASVERVTRKLAGVQESDVNLTTERMRICYDENEVDAETIIQTVVKAGFGCELEEVQSAGETAGVQTANSDTRQDKRRREQEANRKILRDKRYRLIATMIFAVILLYVSMGHMLPVPLPLPHIMDMHAYPVNFAMTQMILTIPVLALNYELFVSGVKSLKNLHPNMNALVTIGCGTSFLYSIIATYLISVEPDYVHQLYFESSAVVVAFICLGKFLEKNNKEKTKGAIYELMALVPDTAFRVGENDSITEIAAEDVRLKDILLVKPGSKVPIDGIVIKGETSVDESMLTGESIPVEKQPGDALIGGSINQNGMVYMEVTKVGEDTTLAKIIQFVEDAQGKKAPISKVADRVAGVFVPTVICIAVLAAVVWALLGYEVSFVLTIFTAVLVVACPCALGLATPTAIMVGTGLGAKYGILVRSGEALEQIHKVTAVVLDKTGTITKGQPEVTDILVNNQANHNEKDEDVKPDEGNAFTGQQLYVLRLAASVEKGSTHPLAEAVAKKWEEHACNTPLHEITGFTNISGKGIMAVSEGKNIYVGNQALMEEHGIFVEDWTASVMRKEQKGATYVFVAEDNEIVGVLLIADGVKETSKEAVAKLKDKGIGVYMITGDREQAAKAVADEVGIDNVFAGVLPEQKAGYIEELQKQGETVMMVGDGINDAPALIQADTGCAIGSGSDIALESGDIVLMKSDLNDVVRAIELSRLTIRNVKQNLFWAFCYNTVGIPVAAGVLYPVWGKLFDPQFAGMTMALSSVCVVGNALRLRGKKL
ncbi:MAG: heavy metal translocating P-type ATPase [Clostridium sp.]|nr:heavy metal translocating P-type ATPase [Clostridium sp.]